MLKPVFGGTAVIAGDPGAGPDVWGGWVGGEADWTNLGDWSNLGKDLVLDNNNDH